MNQNPYNVNQQNNLNQTNNYNLNNEYYQNQNYSVNQSKEFNKNPNLIPETSNSMYNNNNINSNNKNLFKIIGIVVIIIIVLAGIFILKKDRKKSSGNNGYTVEQNEILNVYELEGLYDFDMQILSVEKNFQINYMTSKMNSLAINVKITNTGNENLEIALLKFGLQDNSNNEIANFSIFSNAFILEQPNMFKFDTTLPKNKTMTGYLFFYDTDEEINKKINSDDLKKLVVSVPIYASKDDDVLEIDYEKYFIKLN